MATKKSNDWIEVHRIRDGVACVRITMQQDGQRPKYSIQVGRLGDADALMRYFGVYTINNQGVIELQNSLSPVIAKLYSEAEQWILNRVREYEKTNHHD